MQKVKRLVPELRFKGFDDDWNKAELNDFASINPKNTELPNSFIYIDLESVTNGVLLKEERIFKDNSPSRAQRLLEKNDILYQTVRPYQKNNLYFDKTGEYVASTGYAQIRTKNDSKFLFHFLHTEKLVQNVMLRCTGTSYPSINSSDLSKIKISFPSLPEQQKIASFLNTVDDKIQHLTRKKGLLEQFKKGVMQQLFSGKLRFKPSPIEALEIGDEYPEWEEKKLGDTLEITIDNRGKTPETLEHGIPLLEVNSIGNKEIKYHVVSKFVSIQTFENWFRKYLKEGDVLFSTVGNTALCSYYDGGIKACIAQNIVGLRFKYEIGLFMYYLLTEDRNNNKFKKIEMGAVQPSVKVSQMIELFFNIPCYEEQTKIASFLSAIDEKIEKTTQQLTQTETFKKGLLQQMFV